MKVLLLFITMSILGTPHLAFSQSKGDLRLTLNHAAICVRDLKKSTDFYRTVLGLEELPNPFQDGIHTWFKIGPALQLHIIQRDCNPVPNKNTHLCFSVASLTAFTNHLEKAKVDYTNLKGDGKDTTLRIDGVKQIYLQDPDGYWIEINDAK
ncbi:VOC family protein [Hymenobacter cavernae]|uniref:VOC domain-containing protein n=1 Tax=Hymenobacter cavernae TaxID=2044852 RepID=A0ABQ1UFM9_9BACT|nr:VOC family protein [Hymenobacter cavernae]GGF17997.1 hypothetical protein GCM10011383_31820 [Hymenobacter cavernae]